MTSVKRNAIIMAAGTSSRFVPLSAEIPKGLLEVKGEILIERQIRQLQEAGITDITIVVGYKAEMFDYLRDKYSVELVYNEDFKRYNNTSSIIRVVDRLANTYICSSDNYFPKNVFLWNPKDSFYSALFAFGNTKEYCLKTDNTGCITDVTIGGKNAWYMVGHVYFSKDFSEKFRNILVKEYEKESTRFGYWEDVYIRHIDEMPQMKVHRYHEGDIEEFDSLDELRIFDRSYLQDTRSKIVKEIASRLICTEDSLSHFSNIKNDDNILQFSFQKDGEYFLYRADSNQIIKQ